MTTTCLINSYNYAHFVSEAIQGALNQTEPFDQIVVVDDGSTDGSLEMLTREYDGHPVVQIVGKSNAGQLSCFNEGFAHSTGDIVFFLDADDVYEPNYLEQALRVYHGTPECDFLICGRQLFGQQEGVLLTFPEDRDLGYSVIRTAFAREWVGGVTSCLSMRRAVLEQILPLPFAKDWRVRADDCLVFGASLAGARKRFLAQALVRYRVHQSNNFHGQKFDPHSVYRRRLAINRLFKYLEGELCYNLSQLADIPHREFQTIEKPTLRQLVRYARVSMSPGVSLLRGLSCIAEMGGHYLRSLWRQTTGTPTEEAASSGAPQILPFPTEKPGDSGTAAGTQTTSPRRNLAA